VNWKALLALAAKYRRDLLWAALALLLGALLLHGRGNAPAVEAADRAFLAGAAPYHARLAAAIRGRDSALARATGDSAARQAAARSSRAALAVADSIRAARPPVDTAGADVTGLKAEVASFAAENAWLRRLHTADSLQIAAVLRLATDYQAALVGDSLALNIARARADSASALLAATLKAEGCRILFWPCPSRALSFVLGAAALEGAHLASGKP